MPSTPLLIRQPSIDKPSSLVQVFVVPLNISHTCISQDVFGEPDIARMIKDDDISLRRFATMMMQMTKKGSYEVHTAQHISNDQGCRLIALSNLLFVCPKWPFSTSSLAIPLGYTNGWAFWSSQASRASYMSIGGFRFIISLRTLMYVVYLRYPMVHRNLFIFNLL